MEAAPLLAPSERSPSSSRVRRGVLCASALALVALASSAARRPSVDAAAAAAALAAAGNASSSALNVSSGSDLSHDDILRYLEVAYDSHVMVDCTIRNALCSDAVCTLNSDKLTANCGCLSMDRDAKNPGQLSVGWSSFQMASSTLYQAALKDANDYGEVTNSTQVRSESASLPPRVRARLGTFPRR